MRPLAGWLSARRRQLARPDLERVPYLGYRRERVTEATRSAATALVEGGFVGVLADKVYGVHPGIIALISATPMIANLSSYAWARLVQGRRKVPFIVGLQLSFAALIATIALLPDGPRGAVLLVACMIGCRLLLVGYITVRSLVWTLNYPQSARGRVTARLSLISFVAITATALFGGIFLDANPTSFRVLYATGAALALLGVVAFAGVRVVGEEDQLALERRQDGDDEDADTGIGNRARRPAPSAWGVLRSNPDYARYQLWQFLLGVSNMMVEAPFIYLISRQMGASYAVSIALTTVLPFGCAVLTKLFWASLIDRIHIARFRSRHSWFFVASQLCLFWGALAGSLPILALARVITGCARGGGMLAWQLGHNDFADQERLGLFMGIHVSLTGVRGTFAPFLGMLLFIGWSELALPFGWTLPAFGGLGGGVWLLSALLGIIATFGFASLWRRIERQQHDQEQTGD